MLMTVLYTCRVARPEITRAITFLAKRITKWDFRCDQRLHRLICYVNCATDDQMMGWIGHDPSELSAHLFCDADFAGCPYTLKSTNGCHADIQGPNSRFPWSSGSNGQTSTAQSTPEAELNSLNSGLKSRGEPCLDLLGTILGQYHGNDWKLTVNVREDNTTAIAGVWSGKNPTMKTLERGHGVSIGWLHEWVATGDYNLVHTRSTNMTADIFTKPFIDPVTWTRLRRLVNVYTPDEMKSLVLNLDYLDVTETDDEKNDNERHKGNLNQAYHRIMSGPLTLNSDNRKAVKVMASKRTKQLDQIKKAEANANIGGTSDLTNPTSIVEDGKQILSWTKISKAKRYRDTAAGGPEWKSMVRRTTYDAVTASLLDDVAYPAKLPASRVFAKLPVGKRQMIRTVFLYSLFPDVTDESVDETPTSRDVPKAPLSMKWKVTLLCTDEDSLMEQFNPYRGQCEVVHITVKDDFTPEWGFRKVS